LEKQIYEGQASQTLTFREGHSRNCSDPRLSFQPGSLTTSRTQRTLLGAWGPCSPATLVWVRHVRQLTAACRIYTLIRDSLCGGTRAWRTECQCCHGWRCVVGCYRRRACFAWATPPNRGFAHAVKQRDYRRAGLSPLVFLLGELEPPSSPGQWRLRGMP
jgi:hypothetical protein